MQVVRDADLEAAEIDARLAPALHGHHHDHAARPLRTGRAAAGAAEAGAGHADGQIDLLAAPLAGQGAHVLGRDAGLRLLPFGRLGDAVGFAEQVRLPFVEAGGAGGDVVLVVEALGDPDIHDRLGERRVGLRPDGNPASAQQLGRRIAVRVDMNELDAEFLGPQAARRALEPA